MFRTKQTRYEFFLSSFLSKMKALISAELKPMRRGVISFADAKLIREAKPLLSRSVKAKKRHLGESGGSMARRLLFLS